MGQGSRNMGHCGLTWERMCPIVKLKMLRLKAMERRDHFEYRVKLVKKSSGPESQTKAKEGNREKDRKSGGGKG